MFNIQKAVSRLNFAPRLTEIEITDIKNGVGGFTPKADKPVSFSALKEALRKAGYTLASAKITVSGKLERDAAGRWLVVEESGQRFSLEGEPVPETPPIPNAATEVTGHWETGGEGKDSREVISIIPVKKEPEETQNKRVETPGTAESIDVISGEPLGGPPFPVAPIRTTSPGLTVYRGGARAIAL